MRPRKRIMTRDRAAAVLAVSRRTVTELMKSGQLEHEVTPGGYRRPLTRSVIQLMHERGVAVRYTVTVQIKGRSPRIETYLTRQEVEFYTRRFVRLPDVEAVTITREPWSAAESA